MSTLIGLLTVLLPPGYGQDVDPLEFGLKLPVGRLAPGNGELVLTTGSDGQPIVGKTYVRVGANRIVLLPDGQLVGRTAADTTPTAQAFAPATVDSLINTLCVDKLAGFRTKKTRHYALVYNSSEDFAEAASRILESMVDGMLKHVKAQKIAAHEPEVPLVAILFRTEKEFQEFNPMPPGVVAYYHITANHVVMYEETELWKTRPDLAIQESLSTIAHEGAHQILHNIGVQQRLSRWPMWISEGIAEYYAPTSFGRNQKWKGAGEVNDLRMFNLELFFKGRNANAPNGQMVAQTVSAGQLTSTGYASAWSLTLYLAKHERDSFCAYLREVSQLGPFEGCTQVDEAGIVSQNLVLFKQHFGDEFGKLEAGLVRYLNKLPYTYPFNELPHFLAKIELGNGRRSQRDAQVFLYRNMAQKWTTDLVAKLPQAQQKNVVHEVLRYPNRGEAMQYAWHFLRGGQ